MGGNGMRAIGVIDALEQKLGIPILTANQVALWQALRVAEIAAGVDERLLNYGQLFTH